MPVRTQQLTDFYAAYHADCMEVMPELPSESVGLSIYSPPFPELYQYSDDPRDMCNCVSYDEAMKQYDFVVSEVSRLTKPGRLSCVHATDLKRGIMYQHDFPGDIIRTHERHDMRYFCRVTIWKDAWEFARRTRMKTLMHKSIVNDSANSRLAPGDYLLVFKKVGKNAEPITHELGLRDYAGERTIDPEMLKEFENYKGDQRKNAMSQWIYRQYASPVWMDIRRERLLGGTKQGVSKIAKAAIEDDEERHVCPLQLDVIDRCLDLWSNPGDVVLTPFMGIGSEVYESVRKGRKGVGIELKATYYRQAIKALEYIAYEKEKERDGVFSDGKVPEEVEA